MQMDILAEIDRRIKNELAKGPSRDMQRLVRLFNQAKLLTESRIY